MFSWVRTLVSRFGRLSGSILPIVEGGSLIACCLRSMEFWLRPLWFLIRFGVFQRKSWYLCDFAFTAFINCMWLKFPRVGSRNWRKHSFLPYLRSTTPSGRLVPRGTDQSVDRLTILGDQIVTENPDNGTIVTRNLDNGAIRVGRSEDHKRWIGFWRGITSGRSIYHVVARVHIFSGLIFCKAFLLGDR